MLDIYFGRSIAHGCAIDITEVDSEHINSNDIFTISINKSSAIIYYLNNSSIEIYTNGEIIRSNDINPGNVNIITTNNNVMNLKQEDECGSNTKSIKFTLDDHGRISLLAAQYLPKRPYTTPKNNSLYDNHYDDLSVKELADIIEEYKKEINGYIKRYSQVKEELLKRLELERLS